VSIQSRGKSHPPGLCKRLRITFKILLSNVNVGAQAQEWEGGPFFIFGSVGRSHVNVCAMM